MATITELLNNSSTTEAAIAQYLLDRAQESSGGLLGNISSASPTRILLEVVSAAFIELKVDADRQLQQLFLSELEKIVDRLTGTKALCTIRLQLNGIYNQPFFLPSGYRFAVGNAVFETTADITIPALTDTTQPSNYPACTVNAQALLIGSAANDRTGQAQILQQVTELAAIFIIGSVAGGRERESDAEYLARVRSELESLRREKRGGINSISQIESVARQTLGDGSIVLALDSVKPDLTPTIPAVSVFGLNADGSALNQAQLDALTTELRSRVIGIGSAIYTASLNRYRVTCSCTIYLPPAVSALAIAGVVRDRIVEYLRPGRLPVGDPIRHYKIVAAVQNTLTLTLSSAAENSYGVSRVAIGAVGGTEAAGDLAVPNAASVAVLTQVRVWVSGGGVEQEFVFSI